MKNECSIVRDLLPLYAEGMLSEDSAAFVKEHLDTCEECCALSAGEEPSAPTDADTEQRTGEAGVLRTLKKKLRKQTWCAIVITVAVVLLVTLLLRLNPIDYLADISATKEYTISDRMALLFKGGISDRATALSVLNSVHIVFENKEEDVYNKMAMSREEISYYFGALMNYCVPEVFEGEILTTYHIDLLSAHFGGSSGKMWVKYGYSHFDQAHDLRPYDSTGAIDHIALWKLEKRDDGYWRVVEIVNNMELGCIYSDWYKDYARGDTELNMSWYADCKNPPALWSREIFLCGCLRLAGAAQHVHQLVAYQLLDVGAGGLQILAGIELVGVLVHELPDSAGHGQTQIGVDVDLADGQAGGLTQLLLGHTDGVGHLAAVVVDHLHILLRYGG